MSFISLIFSKFSTLKKFIFTLSLVTSRTYSLLILLSVNLSISFWSTETPLRQIFLNKSIIRIIRTGTHRLIIPVINLVSSLHGKIAHILGHFKRILIATRANIFKFCLLHFPLARSKNSILRFLSLNFWIVSPRSRHLMSLMNAAPLCVGHRETPLMLQILLYFSHLIVLTWSRHKIFHPIILVPSIQRSPFVFPNVVFELTFDVVLTRTHIISLGGSIPLLFAYGAQQSFRFILNCVLTRTRRLIVFVMGTRRTAHTPSRSILLNKVYFGIILTRTNSIFLNSNIPWSFRKRIKHSITNVHETYILKSKLNKII